MKKSGSGTRTGPSGAGEPAATDGDGAAAVLRDGGSARGATAPRWRSVLGSCERRRGCARGCPRCGSGVTRVGGALGPGGAAGGGSDVAAGVGGRGSADAGVASSCGTGVGLAVDGGTRVGVSGVGV